MAWVAKVVTDDDKSDGGTATATFTSQQGETFTYSRRVKIPDDKNAFVAEAKAALQAAAAKHIRDGNLSNALTDALNA